MTNSEQGVSRALASARRCRRAWVDLTHELPEDLAREIAQKWNVADGEMLAFIRALEQEDTRS